MRKAGILLLTLMVIFGGVYGWRQGWFDEYLKDQGMPSQTADGVPAAKDTVVRPTFDIVRAEPTGDIVMAGRAEPGWTVTVESNGNTVGTVVADANGEWLVQPDKPLAQGEHALELKAQDPKTARTLFSKQRIALSLSPGGANRPLVALTEEGKATRVLQVPPQGAVDLTGGERTAALGKPGQDNGKRVSFAAVDYEDSGAKSMLHASGQATPGARVILYIDNEYAGAVTADATGKWTYSGSHELKASSAYALRADLTDPDTSKVMARAEVKFDRDPKQALALLEASKAAAKPTMKPASNDMQIKPAGQAEPAVARAEKGTVTLRDADGNVITVRRGDTLWQIAKRYYGNGEKYTQIFENNRTQIRNPDLIYPSQRFSIPK